MNSAVETEPASRPTLFIEPPGLDLHRPSRFSLLPARSRCCATRKKENERSFGDTPTRRMCGGHVDMSIEPKAVSYLPGRSLLVDVDGLDHRLALGHLQRLRR